ncbi:phosphopyruvate hydratase [Rhodococcus sp. NPDC059968]|uniref:phosphopyruvate hydratase n=1 Tax=Rhodococcus sp. NPDC059968 TaxID=3347017 RepID=UPI00366DE3ED
MTTPTTIASLFAWEALDSRGNPTVACEVRLAGGAVGTAMSPSGASTGTYEALELRDGEERFAGKGVRKAVANVTGRLAAAVEGRDALDQHDVDQALRAADGTAGLHRLGANAVLAVSIATSIAAANASGTPLYRAMADSDQDPLLPMPMINIISGGAHAGRSIDIQDLLVVPVGAQSFSHALEIAWRVRQGTAAEAERRGLTTALIADEGGLGPSLPTNRAALELLAAGIECAGFELGEDAAIALDIASTQFFDPATGTYRFRVENRDLDSSELIEELAAWCNDFPIVSVEDALADQDWDSWAAAATRLPDIQLLGDDLFVTDTNRLAHGIADKIANAVLVKPNQTGTLSDARAVVQQARAANFATVLSARSGETEDAWLADLAVGWRTGQIKVGSTMRSDRTAKWNRLLRIEAELGSTAVFAGRGALAPVVGSAVAS